MQEIRRFLAQTVKDTSEPEGRLVARLVHELPEAANTRLAPIWGEYGLSLSAQGLWAGESLMVETEGAATARGIEIGDLLLLVSLVRHTGEVIHTALLLQVRPGPGEYPPRPDNSRRYGLYTAWPEFTYIKAGPLLNGSRRRIGPPHLYNGAKYVFLRYGDCPWPAFFCHDAAARARWNLACGNPFKLFSYTAFPSSPDLTNFNCLVMELYDFLLGNGRARFPVPAAPGTIPVGTRSSPIWWRPRPPWLRLIRSGFAGGPARRTAGPRPGFWAEPWMKSG